MRVEFIKCMRSAGLPAEVLTEYMPKINEMQRRLYLLNSKIEIYENALTEAEKEVIQ
jgi:hypothetical protein